MITFIFIATFICFITFSFFAVIMALQAGKVTEGELEKSNDVFKFIYWYALKFSRLFPGISFSVIYICAVYFTINELIKFSENIHFFIQLF